ncbi:MAG: acyltransferase family protein [Acidimicrobiales bacterium]
MEGLRLVAAIAVVIFHCQAVSADIHGGGPAGMWLVRTGYFAVDALFVLSGFAQFLPFAAAGRDAARDWRGYAIRRVFRIVPAYYVALVLTCLYIGHFGLGAGHSGRTVGVWELLIHATFLHNLFYGVGGQVGLGIDTAMWTLTAEAAFYVVLPFVAGWFLRRPLAALAGGLAVSLGWRLVAEIVAGSHPMSEYVISQPPAFAFHFAAGMVAALVAVRLRSIAAAGGRLAGQIRWAGAWAVVWSVAALFAWQRAADPAAHQFSLGFALDDRYIWNLVPTMAFAILIVALAVAPRWSYWPLSNRVTRWMGEATYGTYLLHILVMLEIAREWKRLGHQPMPLWAIGGLTLVESILLGRLSFVVVEEPARRFARSLAARWSSPIKRDRQPTRSRTALATPPRLARWGAD